MANLIGRLAASLLGTGGDRPIEGDGRMWTGGFGASRSGVPVTVDAVMQLDVVQAVLENLGGAVSTLPVVVFRTDADGTRRVDRESPLAWIFNNAPNARQSAQEFKDQHVRDLAFHRNAYARIVGEGSTPVAELHQIAPYRVVRIEQDRDGTVYYRVRGLGLSPDEILRDDVMWHLRRAPLTDDGLRGKSVVETGREVFGRAIGVREYGDDFFANSGQAGGTLYHPGKFSTKEAQAEFLEAWREAGTGRKRHRDRLALHGVKYEPHTVNNNEAQFLETVANSDIQVCRTFNMPPHRVGILDRSTLSNIEQQSLDYVMYTLAPHITGFEQGAERDLSFDVDGSGAPSIEINVNGLLRGDIAARMRAYAMARQWGWYSVNDIRRLENLNGIGPEGDRYLEPGNMKDAANGTDYSSKPPGGPGE